MCLSCSRVRPHRPTRKDPCLSTVVTPLKQIIGLRFGLCRCPRTLRMLPKSTYATWPTGAEFGYRDGRALRGGAGRKWERGVRAGSAKAARARTHEHTTAGYVTWLRGLPGEFYCTRRVAKAVAEHRVHMVTCRRVEVRGHIHRLYFRGARGPLAASRAGAASGRQRHMRHPEWRKRVVIHTHTLDGMLAGAPPPPLPPLGPSRRRVS